MENFILYVVFKRSHPVVFLEMPVSICFPVNFANFPPQLFYKQLKQEYFVVSKT